MTFLKRVVITAFRILGGLGFITRTLLISGEMFVSIESISSLSTCQYDIPQNTTSSDSVRDLACSIALSLTTLAHLKSNLLESPAGGIIAFILFKASKLVYLISNSEIFPSLVSVS